MSISGQLKCAEVIPTFPHCNNIANIRPNLSYIQQWPGPSTTMVYQPPTKPSAKALGKRPENRSRKNPLGSPILDHEESTDNVVSTSCPSKDSVESRQKRVLPSRSRRGGPGIGSCDADVHIIDALRRKGMFAFPCVVASGHSLIEILTLFFYALPGENDPLIPPNTIFVLTTDTSMTPSTSAQDLQQNLFANERYFERPEVIKAFREQQDIEIPEYTVLGDEARVGGRLRARGEEVRLSVNCL